LSAPGSSKVLPNYDAVAGAIPIPATLSLELGRVVSEKQTNIGYRFVSDYPFRNRAAHPLDAFEKSSLAALRENPGKPSIESSWSLLSNRVRLITPVTMASACVDCHNSHPDSPKRDWKVGDVRGIQEVSLGQTLASNIFAFKYLLIYMATAATAGFGFIVLQKRQAEAITAMNRELEEANSFLSAISIKISRYLAPQVFKGIFSGVNEVTVRTERKKLTIFFSDISDFTATTERLQPETIADLLNEYFTEMSAIAQAHGGTIDKFIGDALLIFFGDPETLGPAEDAKACVRMALAMQRRLAELSAKWRSLGAEQPFRVRMGINSGFCNVGNFGSTDRMDYTVIGAEANLAARLQSIANPDTIVISHETYVLVHDIIAAHPLPAISMKGVSRSVIPYVVEGSMSAAGEQNQIFNTHGAGSVIYLDTTVIDPKERETIRATLKNALAALDGLQGDHAANSA
jgi:class 3 adenylate cyclase